MQMAHRVWTPSHFPTDTQAVVLFEYQGTIRESFTEFSRSREEEPLTRRAAESEAFLKDIMFKLSFFNF